MNVMRGVRGFQCLPVAPRLERQIEKRSDGCWIWSGTVNDKNYGLIRVQGARQYVHRLMYQMERGPIPDGLELDHLCRNTRCCNPDHLEPVTHRENMARTRRPFCARGHVMDEHNTVTQADGFRRCKECRNQRRAIHYARSGK